jgi:2-oxoglutarate ferredoxin oxidoreductase subunit beta
MFQETTKYLRVKRLPHIWCPGCGNGIVTKGFIKAAKELDLDQDKTVVVCGIGCAARMGGYLDFNTLHTTHGRALTFATGIKLAKPDLNVFVVMGDGDCGTIGGNHLLHAARRNIDLTAIVINNNIYGMTGGQYSATTPYQAVTTTAPYGFMEKPFDLAKLAETAGATFVGRATLFHAHLIGKLIQKGFENKGFSFIEVMSTCPTYYGRYNKGGSPGEMVKQQKELAVLKKAGVDQDLKEGQYFIGELHHAPAPEYCQEYEKIMAAAQAGVKEDA